MKRNFEVEMVRPLRNWERVLVGLWLALFLVVIADRLQRWNLFGANSDIIYVVVFLSGMAGVNYIWALVRPREG